MKIATVSAVFDRKNEADNTRKRGLVQIRVTYDRKTTFFSTGIKIFKNQWDRNRMEVKNSLESIQMNQTIRAFIGKIEAYKAQCIIESTDFSFDELRKFLETTKETDFLEFMQKRIEGRGDLRQSSKKAQLSTLSILRNFGKIRYFSDITVENIKMFDDWLHKQGLSQTTIHGRHKTLKTYINEAMRFDKITTSPYSKVKIERGKPKDGRFITKSDIDKIAHCSLPKALEKVRDLAIVEFYTGLACSDLMSFDFSKVTEVDGQKVILDERQKTGETYYIVLFAPVLDILKKYCCKLPRMSMQQYNMRLKVVAGHAGLECADNISSHWLRRGAGYWALNNGVSMEVVSKFLGHASIRQTESTYAKILAKTIVKEMKKLNNK